MTPVVWTIDTRKDRFAFMLFMTKSEKQRKSRLIRPGNVFLIFYGPILVSLCKLYPQFPVLSWQDWHPAWSSAAVAHLLQDSASFVFRDGILHTLIVRGYLNWILLPFCHLKPVCPFFSDLRQGSKLLKSPFFPILILRLLPCDWLISKLCCHFQKSLNAVQLCTEILEHGPLSIRLVNTSDNTT